MGPVFSPPVLSVLPGPRGILTQGLLNLVRREVSRRPALGWLGKLNLMTYGPRRSRLRSVQVFPRFCTAVAQQHGLVGSARGDRGLARERFAGIAPVSQLGRGRRLPDTHVAENLARGSRQNLG